MIKKSLLKLVLLSLTISFISTYYSQAQEDNGKFVFPDIPGYHTLVCDFHMHTVFSDGLVWPSVRIDEAVREGLDAISITDHIEYRNSHLKGDQNISFEIAKSRADKKDLILIPGTEITRSMPPGHFNAIFIEDANALDTDEWQDAVRIANEQGAYVFWNHPGWQQADEIPIWYEEHSWLLDKGWIQGMEVVNENSYYPLVHQWCIDSSLTMIGNSDIHNAVGYFWNECDGEHRPATLVFAKERSAEGIREALDSRRTAIYYKDKLLGDEQLLKPLFENSVAVMAMVPKEGEQAVIVIKNNSSFTFEMTFVSLQGEELEPFTLKAFSSYPIDFKMLDDQGQWHIKNMMVSPDEYLKIKQ